MAEWQNYKGGVIRSRRVAPDKVELEFRQDLQEEWKPFFKFWGDDQGMWMMPNDTPMVLNARYAIAVRTNDAREVAVNVTATSEKSLEMQLFIADGKIPYGLDEGFISNHVYES